MTTLIIQGPDSEKAKIAEIIKKNGWDIISTDAEDDLSQAEFELLQEAYREAILITQGKSKGIPASELWND